MGFETFDSEHNVTLPLQFKQNPLWGLKHADERKISFTLISLNKIPYGV